MKASGRQIKSLFRNDGCAREWDTCWKQAAYRACDARFGTSQPGHMDLAALRVGDGKVHLFAANDTSRVSEDQPPCHVMD